MWDVSFTYHWYLWKTFYLYLSASFEWNFQLVSLSVNDLSSYISSKRRVWKTVYFAFCFIYSNKLPLLGQSSHFMLNSKDWNVSRSTLKQKNNDFQTGILSTVCLSLISIAYMNLGLKRLHFSGRETWNMNVYHDKYISGNWW